MATSQKKTQNSLTISNKKIIEFYEKNKSDKKRKLIIKKHIYMHCDRQNCSNSETCI